MKYTGTHENDFTVYVWVGALVALDLATSCLRLAD
jgi:hypothetical protein